jgi:hypothetical protein
LSTKLRKISARAGQAGLPNWQAGRKINYTASIVSVVHYPVKPADGIL